MTLTRRQTLTGAAATVAVAALPAVKSVMPWSMEFEQDDAGKFVLTHYTDQYGNEWAGDPEYIEIVRMIQEREVVHV